MQKAYKISALLIILSLTCGIFGGYVLAQSPSQVTYLGAGSLTESASYVIWKDGTNHFCKDGETGRITTDTNASAIIQTAIDNTDVSATLGGIVFVKAGTYTLPVALTLSQKVTIKGEGINATIFYGSNPSNYVFFGSYGAASVGRWMGLEDLCVKGGKGVYAEWCLNWEMTNVIIQESSAAGLTLKFNYGARFNNLVINQATTNGLDMDFCNELSFVGLTITACGSHGIAIQRSETNHFVGVDIEYNTGYGLLGLGVSGLDMSGWFENNGYEEILLTNSSTGYEYSKDIHFYNMLLDNYGDAGSTGIGLQKATNIILEGVRVWNSTYPVYVAPNSSNVVAYPPSGYTSAINDYVYTDGTNVNVFNYTSGAFNHIS